MSDKSLHTVMLDADRCKGCISCMKRCPTEAIRVRNGKAKVLVLEKMAFVGGSTLLSSTAYNAGGASVQKNYTAEDYEAKLLKGIPNADEHDRANVKQLAQLT